MAIVYFINIDKLEDNSPLNGNVDSKILNPIIYTAQDIYLQPILGSAIYNQLKEQITNNTLTAANTTLLNDYIQPCLTWYVMYDAPVSMSYKYMNKAVVKRTDPNAETVSYDDLIDIANKNLEKAQFYSKRLSMFLLSNLTTYPLYSTSDSSYDTIVASVNAYSTGLVLDEDCTQKSSLTYNKNSNKIERGKSPFYPFD